MTDQQRFDSLSCYGCEAVDTPNIDSLAVQGALFENCYVNNPICTPSRAGIFTGKTLTGHGVFRLHDKLPDDQYFFTERLRENGYKTALFGKLHVSGRCFERDSRNLNDGFDIYEYSIAPHALGGKYNAYQQWLKENHPVFYEKLVKGGRKIGKFPQNVHFTKWAADRTIDFFQNHDINTPFFCCMSVVDPHDPYSDFPPEMEELVKKKKIPKPVLSTNLRPDAVEKESMHGLLGACDNYTADNILKMRVGYYASIAFLDNQVGRVLKALNSSGLEDNTMVVFLSDHGDMLGDHGLLAKGAYFYEPSVHVPFIIKYPKTVPCGIRVKDVVQPYQLAYTILKAAGIESNQDNIDTGTDLLQKALSPDDYNSKGVAVCEYRSTGICDKKTYWSPDIHATMLFDGRYKLNIFHAGDTQGQLFDLHNDPDERNDLWSAPEFLDKKHELTNKLLNWKIEQDIKYHGSRGGEFFPPKQQTCLNNPL